MTKDSEAHGTDRRPKRGIGMRHAINGILHLYSVCGNIRIHTAAAIAAAAAGWISGLSAAEWGVVAPCIGTGMAAETFNTDIETLADRVVPQHDEAIKHVKDMAAGAVLITATAALVAGIVIFMS